MAAVELLPKEYGYVVLVLVGYCFLNLWMAGQVGKARKKYKIFYPTMYATEAENKDAKLFNCVQRSPEFTGNDAHVFMLMILGGIKHPVIAALLGVMYAITRFFYFTGYSTGDPKNRFTIGKYGFVALLGLMICTISAGVRMLCA